MAPRERNQRTTLSLAALLCGAFLASPQEDERPPHERIDVPSVAACGGCHERVVREWSESLHARAWTNANVRAATDDFKKKSCRPCHSPRSIFETGLERQPAFRDFNQLDGVHCLSCHGLSDGVAAARTLPDAPCRPRREPRLLQADHCYPCHQPTHHAFDEYRTSDAFALGIRCVDCHMQERPDASGRSHGPHGGMNAGFVRRAIAWEARRVDAAIEVKVRNRTGHKFPGEIPSRAFVLHLELEGREPQTLLLRKPFRGEERADDRLRPDEERTFRFPVPADAGAARLRLLFRPLPLMPLDAAFELGEWSG